MRNMVSKWYGQSKQATGPLTSSKIFGRSPKGDANLNRNLSISGILEKNGEDHFNRMNSQIKEFGDISKQFGVYPLMDDGNGSAEKKKQ